MLVALAQSACGRTLDASADFTGNVFNAGEVAVRRRVQLPGDTGHHDPRLEKQPTLESQRALVVQHVLPPPTHDVLGDVDVDHVAGTAVPLLLDVIHHGPSDLPVGRLNDLERDVDIELFPFALECP